MTDSNEKHLSEPNMTCPICMREDGIKRLSDLYCDMLNGKADPHLAGHNKNKFISYISPPGLPQKNKLKSMHPDLLAGIIITVAVYLFFTQKVKLDFSSEPILIVIFAGLIYLAYRKTLMTRYQKTKNDRFASMEIIRKQAEIWSELIYCSHDRMVFSQDKSLQIKVEDLPGYWKSNQDFYG